MGYAELSCRCGEVRGRVAGAAPDTVNRVVCYCDDCQTFAHHLGRADILDAHGGTDIVQVAPASLTFTRGEERVVGLRLGPKGLYRFYADCCKTPLGNVLGPGLPFVGIAAQAFAAPDEAFGKPTGAIQGRFAVGTPPAGSDRLDVWLLARVFRRILGWRLTGKGWPNPYFDRETRAPRRPVHVISREERDAVRPLCGPRAG